MAPLKNYYPPLIFQFESAGYQFVLDLHTNRLFRVDDREAEVFRKWSSGEPLSKLFYRYPKEVSEIEKLESEGLFCSRPPVGLKYGGQWDSIVNKILHERVRTVLEITQACNLRCSYCTFGGGFVDHRNHSNQVMSEDIAKKAIDEALLHGDSLEEISIGFYGGEPLLCWSMVDTVTRYSRMQSSSKKVRFSITTNATLIDKKKARFFRDNDFSVLVSLDGPHILHNMFRRYQNGKGSYTSTIQGLKTLLDVFPPESHQKIGLNMVIPSPSWISVLERLWEEEPWLPRNIRAQASLVSPPSGFIAPEVPPEFKDRPYKKKWLRALETGNEMKSTLGQELFDKSMAKLHQRARFNGYRRLFYPHGCCIPGTRTIYVSSKGEYKICERAHGVPPIGSLYHGLDLNRIKKLVKEYAQSTFIHCRKCSVLSICMMCFMHVYVNGQYNGNAMERNCKRLKQTKIDNLKLYAYLTQKYPQKVVQWDEAVII